MKTKLLLLILILGLGISCEDDSDDPLSTETDILTFSFAEQTGDADIDDGLHNIEIEVANGTDLTKLTPTFIISDGATADPVSGTESDYSSRFTIAVTAEDGSGQAWEINVKEAESDLSKENDILTFTIAGETGPADIDYLVHNVGIEVANGTDLTSLAPTWTLSEGATSDPVSGTESDYSSRFTIAVTAEDGSGQAWEINVREAE